MIKEKKKWLIRSAAVLVLGVLAAIGLHGRDRGYSLLSVFSPVSQDVGHDGMK